MDNQTTFILKTLIAILVFIVLIKIAFAIAIPLLLASLVVYFGFKLFSFIKN